MSIEPLANIGIVTVSDRASRGEYEDRGGPAIANYLQQVLASGYREVVRVIPDERLTMMASQKVRPPALQRFFRTSTYYMYAFTPEKPLRLVGRSFCLAILSGHR
jgi:hypothetical protein